MAHCGACHWPAGGAAHQARSGSAPARPAAHRPGLQPRRPAGLGAWGGRRRSADCMRVGVGSIREGELVSSEEEFLQKISQRQGPVVVDWMAKWCRKCIYLKPKLEKLLHDEFPGLDLVFIDVNSIPGQLVYGHGIKKMPTITIHDGGTKVREHIAAEAGLKAITNIRTMIKDYLDQQPADTQAAVHK